MPETYLIHARGVYESDAQRLAPADGVCIAQGRIAAIGSYKEMHRAQPGLETLELGDCWLFPGLINTHVHLEFSASPRARLDFMEGTPGVHMLQAARNAETMLRSGVTTLRDAGSSWQALDLKHPQVQALWKTPRMQLAGPPLTVTGGHLHFLGEETDGETDMIRQVRLRQKRGCDAIKLIVTGGQMTPGSAADRVSLTLREVEVMTGEAKRLGLRTFAHCLTTEGVVRCMDGGVDCIEHIACFVRRKDNGRLERIYETGRMEAFRGQPRDFMMGLSAGYHNLDDFRSGKRPCGPDEAFWLEQETRMFDIFKKCVDLGLRPVCGTDAGTSGTYFDETWLEAALMVERGGLLPVQAIQAATADAASCLGLEAETGRLAEGYAADLIALEENPMENIRALGNVRLVISRGERIEPSIQGGKGL